MHVALQPPAHLTALHQPLPSLAPPFSSKVGGYKIVFQADAPDARQIPAHDLLGVTVILLSCFYKDREFIRIGYYVSNEYDCEELNANPPEQVRLLSSSIMHHQADPA
jgi:hypothetical protein